MDIYSTAVLRGVVTNLFNAQSWLLDRYFPNEMISDTEDIYFDVEVGRRRLAPFVSPLVQGKIMDSNGFRTNVFRPAYVKDKRVFDPTKPLRRTIGEQIGGSYSPMERSDLNLKIELQDQLNCLTRREEWMAAQQLFTGSVTVSGELYQTVVVNFGRSATHQIALAAGSKWTDAGVSVLDNLQTWSTQIMLKDSGAPATDVVMDTAAWTAFRRNPEVLQRWNTLNPNRSDLNLDAKKTIGGTSMGKIDGFEIFVYSDWFIDDTGTEQPMIPNGTVLLASPLVEGTRNYGVIKDHESGFRPIRYFPKSWIEPDPSVRYLMLQSAPLPAMFRPNASLAASVL